MRFMIPVKPHTYQTRFWHLFRDVPVVKNESNECPQVTFPWTTRCPKAHDTKQNFIGDRFLK